MANPGSSLRFNTHWSAQPVSALARFGGPGARQADFPEPPRATRSTPEFIRIFFLRIKNSIHQFFCSYKPGTECQEQQHGAQNVEKRMRDNDTDESESKSFNFGVWVSDKLVFSQSSIYIYILLVLESRVLESRLTESAHQIAGTLTRIQRSAPRKKADMDTTA